MKQIIQHNKGCLYYPRSVERFYHTTGYQLAWVAPDTVKSHVYNAMLLLDCVGQYGLNHADYHPKQLLYTTLQKLVKSLGTKDEEAAFDILMTDAMIRLVNNLHYGKLNPVYTTVKLDKGIKFKTDAALLAALKVKIFWLLLIASSLNLNCTSICKTTCVCWLANAPAIVTRYPRRSLKMAINMERLRWISTTGKKVHLTLIVKSGGIIEYQDTYKTDKSLTKAFYKPSPRRLNRSPMSSITGTVISRDKKITADFLFDMGATGCLFLNQGFLQQNKLYGTMQTLGEAQTTGAGSGVTKTMRALLPGFSFGHYHFKQVPVNLENPAENDPGTGVLRMDLLKRFHTILDYQNNMIWLKPDGLVKTPFKGYKPPAKQ